LERSTDEEQIERGRRRRPPGRRFDKVEVGLVEWDRWSGRRTDEEKRDLKEAESSVDEKGWSTSGQIAKNTRAKNYQTRPKTRSPKGEDEKRTHPLNGRPTREQIAENTRTKKTIRTDQIVERR
jgi:hypothetical protein